MTEQYSSFQPTWQSVKGGLIHRCVLPAASKWLTMHQALEPDAQHGAPEPHLVAEAQWMAGHLKTALVDEDPRLAWSLIDSGGPRWIAAEVTRKYGEDVAGIINADVLCQVLGLSFDGDHRWSRVVVAHPVQNDG